MIAAFRATYSGSVCEASITSWRRWSRIGVVVWLIWTMFSKQQMDRWATWMLLSSSSSSTGLAWAHGFLDKLSASTLSAPFIHLVLKVRWSTFILRRWSLLFSISGNEYFSKIGTKGAWSVQTSNWDLGRPSTNILHLFVAQQMASSSSSIMAYLVSAGDKNRDPACTVFQAPASTSCFNTNPRPNSLDASAMSLVGFVAS